jgi:hypothetical protein
MNIISLWLPVLVSAGVVWICSALVWTVLPWHKKDYSKTNDEEAVRAALKGNSPGMYMVPYCKDPASQAAAREKYEEGPNALITVAPNGWPQMGGKLVMSFFYNLLVGIVCAYFVSRTLAPDAEYLAVFRIAGAVAFCSYGLAYIQESIWFFKPWSLTAKSLFDALLYGMLTGGVFGWLA